MFKKGRLTSQHLYALSYRKSETHSSAATRVECDDQLLELEVYPLMRLMPHFCLEKFPKRKPCRAASDSWQKRNHSIGTCSTITIWHGKNEYSFL